jgi:hypothetical protein
MSRLIAYVVKHDYGFAPNPYGGFLTLATCKAPIRNAAKVGDILLGTGAVKNVGMGKLIYAARISEIVDTEAYGREERFAIKRPVVGQGKERRLGDNIYYREAGQWRQRENPFHDEGNIAIDLASLKVLVCADFWYFGNAAADLSAHFPDVIKQGPGCKYTRDPARVKDVLAWLEGFEKGVHGQPSKGGPHG